MCIVVLYPEFVLLTKKTKSKRGTGFFNIYQMGHNNHKIIIIKEKLYYNDKTAL